MNSLQTHLDDLVDTQHLEKTVQTILKQCAKKGATAAEVGLSVSQGLSMTARLKAMEKIEFNRDKGLGLTVYIDHKKGSASTNDLSEKAIERTIDAAIHFAHHTEEDPFSGLAEKAEMAQSIIDCDLYHPWNISLDEAKSLALDCEAHALSQDKAIQNSEGASVGSYQSYRIYGNSHGFMGSYPSTRHMLSCVVIAQDAQGMQRDYEYTVSRHPGALWSAKRVGVEAAKNTVKRLKSAPIPTQHLPVIFKNKVASGLIGHFCGAISGSRLYRKSSFLQDCQGQQVFPSFFTMSEFPHLKQGLGSAPFDGDGVQTKERTLVKDGIVQGYILSAYSARKLGLSNTGNAGGVRNLILETSDKSLEDLIASQDKALLVTELMGQGINLVNGDYSRGAAGYLIEKGKITKPVHEVTIAANLKEMFKGMQCIANDVDPRGNIQTGSILIDHMMVAGN